MKRSGYARLSTPTHIPSYIVWAFTEEWLGGEIKALTQSYELVSVDSSAHSTHLYNHCSNILNCIVLMSSVCTHHGMTAYLQL